MSNDISTVAVVFRDLSDAFDELSTQKLSPLKVRTTFSNFLELSSLSEEVDAELLELGDRNIHRLGEKYFDTLKKYYRYYQEQLTAQ